MALLVGELLYLTTRFDSQALDNAASPWLRFVASSPHYLQFGITVALILIALHAKTQRGRVIEGRLMSPGARIACLGIHLASLYAFTQVSSRIFDGRVQPAAAAAWVSAWIAIGAAVLMSWGLMLLRSWPKTLAQRRNPAMAAAAVGLGALVWTVAMLSEALWRIAAGATFALAASALRLFYDDVVSRPERLILGTRRFRVNIAPTCSGLEGVGLILAFLAIYLWLYRKELRFPAALVLFPVGAAAIWLLNAVRIVLLIVIGSSGWRQIALGGFHSQAGWLTFNVVALGFVALVNRGGWFNSSRPESKMATADFTAAYLTPFMAVIATAAVTGALSSGFDWLYPLRVVAGAWALWFYRNGYPHLRISVTWRAIAIGVVAFGLWLALAPNDVSHRVGWPMPLLEAPLVPTIIWLLFRIVGSTVVVPIAEELAFRGYLTRRLVGADVERLEPGVFTWPSFMLSSVLFGLLHGTFWIGGIVAGMAFAIALYQRREIRDAITAHATTNGLLAMYALLTGRWSLWS